MKSIRRKKIGVLMGGISAEREISLKTGNAILSALLKMGFKAVGIDVKKDIFERLIKEKIDVAFVALHGKFGEDGCVQGILEFMGIPYTGSGVLGSALSMNKLYSRIVWEKNGVPVPPYKVIKWGADFSNPFGFPVVIKPVDEGSSIGVSIVQNEKEMEKAIKEAFRFSEILLLEKFIKGKEVHVAILNNSVLGSVEIRPSRKFYDYTAKYTSGMTEYIIPPTIDRMIIRRLEKTCLKAHILLGLEGVSRIDAIVKGKNFYLLEANSIPGMTATSLVPKIANSKGISFEQLVLEILKTASLKIKRREK
jgi:D-alanine-D-alanine ligase